MADLSMTHEDYLEAIVMLGGAPGNAVRAIDIAEKMSVSKTSVSKAIAVLKQKGYVEQPYYGDITLTSAGVEYGNKVLRRHRALTDFLITKIGIEPDVAEDEACKMEHAISDDSFEKWLKFFKSLDSK